MKTSSFINQTTLFVVVVSSLCFGFALSSLAANLASEPRLVSQQTTRKSAEVLCRSKFGPLPLFAQTSYLDSDGERSCDVYVYAKSQRWNGREKELIDSIRFHRAQLAAYVDSIRMADQLETLEYSQSEFLNHCREKTDYHVRMSTKPDEFFSIYTSASRNHKPVMEYRDGLPESYVMPYDLEQLFDISPPFAEPPLDYYYFGPARIFAAESKRGSRVLINLINPDFTLVENQVSGIRFNMSELDDEAIGKSEESWARIEAMTDSDIEAVARVSRRSSHIIPDVPYFRQGEWDHIFPAKNTCVVMAGGSAIGYYDDFGYWNISPFSWHLGGNANGGFHTLPGVNYEVTIPGAPDNPTSIHYGPESMLLELAIEAGYNFLDGGTIVKCHIWGFTLDDIFERYTNDHLGFDFDYDQDCFGGNGASYETIMAQMDANRPMILRVTNFSSPDKVDPYPYVGLHAVAVVGYDDSHSVGGDPVGVYINGGNAYDIVWWDYDQIRSDNDEITLEISPGGPPEPWVDEPTLTAPVGTIDPGQVHFEWTDSVGAGGYLLQVSRFQNFRSYEQAIVTTNSEADISLTDEGTYYWRVASANPDGVYCRLTEEQSFTVGECCSTWHVAADGSDQTGDGTDSNPFATIQRAIDASGHFDVVLVGPGTYYENISITKQIHVTSHMFETWEEGYIDETIIDGGRSGSVVTIGGSTASLAELSGFTIRNGFASSGGGVAVINASPTLRNLKIVDNEAISGGGLDLNRSSSLVEDVTVTGNLATQIGCGSVGGGIACQESSPTLRNITVSNNQAALSGGGIHLGNNSDSTLENVVVANNSVVSTDCFSSGGGIGVGAGEVTMTNVTIRDNEAVPLLNASSGAGLAAQNALVNITDGTVSGNQSSAAGGGITLSNSTLKLTRVEVYDNRATGTMLGGGALFVNSGSSAYLVNVTMADNEANMGSGVHCQDGSTLVLVNSIAWSSSSIQTIFCSTNGAPSTLAIDSSNIQGGQSGILLNGNATLNWLGGNLDQDPLFSNPGNNGFDLQTMSPCIDSGTSYFEWGSEVLVDLTSVDYSGDGPDMGAHETTVMSALVDPSGSGDFSTISDAVDNVPSGAVIILSSGVYSGAGNRDIDLGGRAITIRSGSKNADGVVIDCQGTLAEPHRGFYFHSGEGAMTRIEGVTIVNGYAGPGLPGGEHGGGILCENGSSPSIVNVTFSNNTAQGKGGALYCVASSPILESCTISGNHASEGSGVGSSNSSAPAIQGSIIVFNGPGEAVHCGEGSLPVISCSDIFGNSGGDWVGAISGMLGVDGNIDDDPFFCSSAPDVEMDWTLQDNSPCLVENNPGACHMGAWTIGCSSPVGVLLPDLITVLGDPYPNPFNPTGIIPFSLDRAQQVRLSIYDIAGNLVTVLLDQPLPQGEHHEAWNGLNRVGQPVSSGVYFVRFQGASTNFSRKLALVR